MHHCITHNIVQSLEETGFIASIKVYLWGSNNRYLLGILFINLWIKENEGAGLCQNI